MRRKEGAVMANVSATGEAVTGFIEGQGRGEFNCGNCVHMDHAKGVCEHPVMKVAHKGEKSGGFPIVDRDDCCQFQRRKGD